jgi:deoxyadenosine/deoxycytidine kinase
VISSADFLQVETSLSADLDGDGKIGLNFGAIKTVGNVQFGTTQLGYALKDGSNTLLSITNAGAVAAATGGWSALAAAATGSGYDLYWKNINGTYAKWSLNSSAALTNGAVISSADFLQVETSLSADLDGDGKIGLSFGAIKTVGNVQFGTTQLGYALKDGSNTLLSITNAGAVAAATGGWSALAAAATGSGYDLYWKNINGTYAKWSLNSSAALTNGAVISSADFLQVETSLSADLDGDGKIGLSFGAIKTVGNVQFGTTQLGYALKDGSNTLLSITNAGAVAAATGGWSALAAAATGSGYDLYWKNINGTYAKWSLNSSAALTSGAVISSADFLQTEMSLAADLDGDDKTGLFAIYRGTADNDIITGKGNVSFGLAGNDTLTAGGSSSLGFDILIGGSGSDSYVVPSGKTVIVADEGSSAGDRLNSLGFSFNRTSTTASTLEGGRHLVIDDSSTGSRIYILDWKDATNIIEIVALADATYSFDQMQQKIESLGSLPDYSWAQWDSLLGGSELTMLGIASSSAIDNFSAFYRSISGGG